MSYVVGPEVITESLRQIAVSRLLLFETALAILIARWVRAATGFCPFRAHKADSSAKATEVLQANAVSAV